MEEISDVYFSRKYSQNQGKCKANVLQFQHQKWHSVQNSCDYRYMSPPVNISLFYSPWFLPQKIGSRIRGLCRETFLGPILLNQQMWIIGMTLTSTTTFSCLVASRAFEDLPNISEKSCASLISWCALVLFAPSWVWKASFTPAPAGPDVAARQRQQGTALSSWPCLPASFHMDTNAWRSPAGCRAHGAWCHLG